MLLGNNCWFYFTQRFSNKKHSLVCLMHKIRCKVSTYSHKISITHRRGHLLLARQTPHNKAGLRLEKVSFLITPHVSLPQYLENLWLLNLAQAAEWWPYLDYCCSEKSYNPKILTSHQKRKKKIISSLCLRRNYNRCCVGDIEGNVCQRSMLQTAEIRVIRQECQTWRMTGAVMGTWITGGTK